MADKEPCNVLARNRTESQPTTVSELPALQGDPQTDLNLANEKGTDGS